MNAPLDLRALRKDKRIPQAALSKAAGVPLNALMQLERGLRVPTPEQVAALTQALGVATFAEAEAVAGEGYVTSASVNGLVIPRRMQPDLGLRPVWDLFCGTGGFGTGFEASGEFQVVVGVDLLGDRLNTFTANHFAASAYGGDIRRIPTLTLLDANPRPFVVVGGPPCQGFSSIRPFRNVEWSDPRNNLGEEFCRVVAESKPEWLVFENVVGLLTHEGGATLRALVSEFEGLGYRVSFRVLNAAFHGLPQRRERLVIVGSRRGKAFDWPTPTHGHGHRSMAGKTRLLLAPLAIDDVHPALTVMDGIGDLPPVKSGETATAYELPPQNRFQELLRHGADRLTMHEATAHGRDMLEIIRHAGENINALPPGMVTSGFSTCYSRLAADEPANTITVNFVHPASNRCIHPFQHRALTPREGARLQGFPDAFAFKGTRSQVVKQIGNAVPPLLGRVIADALLDSD